MKRELTRADILAPTVYANIRADRKQALIARKKKRRVAVGPHATFYFENYDTMWAQVHEMLHIEQGGEAQIADELAAYNPLIPKGHELVATLMFEIDDQDRRTALLASLGGVEETVEFRLGAHTIKAIPEQDIDRTSADGKASSVQFLHFPFTSEQILAFRAPKAEIVLAITHPAYAHMAGLPEAVRQELAGDFL